MISVKYLRVLPLIFLLVACQHPNEQTSKPSEQATLQTVQTDQNQITFDIFYRIHLANQENETDELAKVTQMFGPATTTETSNIDGQQTSSKYIWNNQKGTILTLEISDKKVIKKSFTTLEGRDDSHIKLNDYQSLNIGKSLSDVIALFGTPHVAETSLADGGTIMYSQWFSKDEKENIVATTLRFENDKLTFKDHEGLSEK